MSVDGRHGNLVHGERAQRTDQTGVVRAWYLINVVRNGLLSCGFTQDLRLAQYVCECAYYTVVRKTHTGGYVVEFLHHSNLMNLT